MNFYDFLREFRMISYDLKLITYRWMKLSWILLHIIIEPCERRIMMNSVNFYKGSGGFQDLINEPKWIKYIRICNETEKQLRIPKTTLLSTDKSLLSLKTSENIWKTTVSCVEYIQCIFPGFPRIEILPKKNKKSQRRLLRIRNKGASLLTSVINGPST